MHRVVFESASLGLRHCSLTSPDAANGDSLSLVLAGFSEQSVYVFKWTRELGEIVLVARLTVPLETLEFKIWRSFMFCLYPRWIDEWHLGRLAP